MPDVSVPLRPVRVPRALRGPDGVLAGTGAEPASARDAALTEQLRVTGVTHASGQVEPGDLYAALPGERTHGAKFAVQAAARGAAAVLTDPAGAELAAGSGLPLLVHEHPRSVLGRIAAAVYGRPGDDLLLIGVTGTNGKTTLTYLVDAALRAAGHTTGVIGTVGTRVADERIATVRTTPEATDVHALLAVMRERGVTAVAMEVSSHALVLGRVDGLVFDVAVFTNLSQDHLDFHRDLEDYFAAKASLFVPARARSAVVCLDDEWGRRLHAQQHLPATTYSTDPAAPAADWHAGEVRELPGGSAFHAHGPDGCDVAVELGMAGTFNVANAIGAVATAARAGVAPATAAAGITACPGVPGRMERIADPAAGRGIVALVDYAHTPDAVERAVRAARAGVAGRVVVVVGAGGDRDSRKRTDMGRVAAEHADVVVVTDDNPRSEDPAAIRAAVVAGATDAGAAAVLEVPDRREAIGAAVAGAGPGDVVLVLGKGHEQGQEVAGRVHAFDDRIVLSEALAAGPR